MDYTMKKFIYMAVAAIAVLSSCSGNDAVLDENGQNEEAMTITVAMEDFDGPTTRTTLNTSTLQPEWVEGDQIRLVNQYKDAYYEAESSGPTATFKKRGTPPQSNIDVFYPTTMYESSKKKLPASYTYESGKFGMPMYAFVASNNDINNIQMKNLCAVLAITVPSSQVSKAYGIEVSSDQQLNGELNSIDYSTGGFTFTSATLTDDNKKVSLAVDRDRDISDSKTFYLPIPPGTHNPLTIKVYTDINKTSYKQMTTKKSGGVTVERNKIYPITFADNQEVQVPTIQPNNDTKVFNGLFSVSATKQVRFTKANLYWNGSTYQFESNQTDYPTSWSSSHVGHFYFSKTASVTYAQTYSDASAAANDTYCFNENSKLTIGSYQYYLLTYKEWEYVTLRRNNASNLLKHYETVTDGDNKSYYPCTLIAPDNFDTSNWKSSGSYTLEELNSLGVVILPPAGYRDGSSIDKSGIVGWYWTSTSASDESIHAYTLNFVHHNTVVWGYPFTERNNAKSIRLVSDVVKQ